MNSNIMSPNGTSRDVGVAIALRQHNKQQPEATATTTATTSLTTPPRAPRESSERRRDPTTITRRREPPTKRLWWQDLLYGLTVYLLCIYLPYLYQQFQHVYQNFWCPFVLVFTKKLIGGDAAWSDFYIIMVLSTSLAIVRIAVVQWLVDMASPTNVQAMVRCKSIHLLSSAYPQSLTPTTKRPIASLKISGSLASHGTSHGNLSAMAAAAPSLPDLSTSRSMSFLAGLNKSNESLQPRTPTMKRSDSWLESTWESVRRSSEKALINPRLHAAPRYATALFRCMYGTVALSTAWFGFAGSDFWPAAVGGSGETKNCWNLKGSPGMEEDFDDLNALLKFYYLLQASYHLHSGAFHVLTMMILWARRASKQNGKKNGNAPTKPFTSYWRSLLQHSIALCLIGGSHLFASTRRLGAIGSFALDASSLVLHLLQVCINAPQPIPRYYIRILHRGVVIPIFLYCRFYVWPFVVWKSAWLESKDWLRQMESTMFPGIYEVMIWLFTLLTLVLLGLNLVLLKRLVNHPHLQRVYNNSNNNS